MAAAVAAVVSTSYGRERIGSLSSRLLLKTIYTFEDLKPRLQTRIADTKTTKPMNATSFLRRSVRDVCKMAHSARLSSRDLKLSALIALGDDQSSIKSKLIRSAKRKAMPCSHPSTKKNKKRRCRLRGDLFSPKSESNR